MSYLIGRKIYEFRIQKKVSQEEVASALGISRQRLARIENGQSEIPYSMIQKAAEYLAVSVNDITSADETLDLKLYFRDVENADAIDDSVGRIVNILKTFHAHEKLYLRMKGKEDEV